MRPTRSRSTRTSAAETGFTVIELSITLGMLLMVIGSLVTVFLSVQRTQVFTQERSQSLDEMRLAIDRLTKEARQATTLDDSSNASRLDMQTFVNGVSTHVVYHVVSDTTLVRTVGTTDATILTNMNSGNVFAYTPSVSGAQIITVTLSVHPARRPDTVLELKSEIRLRNEGRT